MLLLLGILPLALGAETRAFRDLSPAEQVEVMRSEAWVALVIGNGAYSGAAALRNPLSDAQAVAEALRQVGFSVTYERDLGNIAMKQALAAFGRQLEAGGVGLFYYAGHGIQHGGTNHLVPVDAQLARPDDLEVYGAPVEAVLAFAL
ncbi:MAG: caspase family protein [Pseudomonadota bacterium]